MSENIAGYIDRSCIKGQIYKLAGCPKPVVAGDTVNINEISSSLLSKAVYATKGQTAGGDFPNPTDIQEGLVFLITTIEFGNGVYLQSATSMDTQIEYKRINTNGIWTNWRSADSTANEAKGLASDAKGDVEQLSDTVSDLQEDVFSTDSDKTGSIQNQINRIKGTSDGNSENIISISSKLDVLSSRLSSLGTKIVIARDKFEGTIDGHSTTSDITVTVLNYTSIYAVIPFGYDPGTASRVAIPFIVEINQPNNGINGSFKYRLYRPASGNSQQYTNFTTKFLILGTGTTGSTNS